MPTARLMHTALEVNDCAKHLVKIDISLGYEDAADHFVVALLSLIATAEGVPGDAAEAAKQALANPQIHAALNYLSTSVFANFSLSHPAATALLEILKTNSGYIHSEEIGDALMAIFRSKPFDAQLKLVTAAIKQLDVAQTTVSQAHIFFSALMRLTTSGNPTSLAEFFLALRRLINTLNATNPPAAESVITFIHENAYEKKYIETLIQLLNQSAPQNQQIFWHFNELKVFLTAEQQQAIYAGITTSVVEKILTDTKRAEKPLQFYIAQLRLLINEISSSKPSRQLEAEQELSLLLSTKALNPRLPNNIFDPSHFNPYERNLNVQALVNLIIKLPTQFDSTALLILLKQQMSPQEKGERTLGNDLIVANLIRAYSKLAEKDGSTNQLIRLKELLKTINPSVLSQSTQTHLQHFSVLYLTKKPYVDLGTLNSKINLMYHRERSLKSENDRTACYGMMKEAKLAVALFEMAVKEYPDSKEFKRLLVKANEILSKATVLVLPFQRQKYRDILFDLNAKIKNIHTTLGDISDSNVADKKAESAQIMEEAEKTVMLFEKTVKHYPLSSFQKLLQQAKQAQLEITQINAALIGAPNANKEILNKNTLARGAGDNDLSFDDFHLMDPLDKAKLFKKLTNHRDETVRNYIADFALQHNRIGLWHSIKSVIRNWPNHRGSLLKDVWRACQRKPIFNALELRTLITLASDEGIVAALNDSNNQAILKQAPDILIDVYNQLRLTHPLLDADQLFRKARLPISSQAANHAQVVLPKSVGPEQKTSLAQPPAALRPLENRKVFEQLFDPNACLTTAEVTTQTAILNISTHSEANKRHTYFSDCSENFTLFSPASASKTCAMETDRNAIATTDFIPAAAIINRQQ